MTLNDVKKNVFKTSLSIIRYDIATKRLLVQ